ncbi:thioredoxin domain-containing protein [Plantibacter sp. VKM Ac-2880]|uniref:DsbA family protein n=1 Tax=Plantibacter sp. VKM Ac-2880 TaxID=2783827 RepID=UPI00188E1440|nr:DsbA family protein [Plantibacter sp. VKM Ac-2880]MBF4570869.1 thioredoxin domain-containing protein [Plantibacter sp. VKM Ac-2880]
MKIRRFFTLSALLVAACVLSACAAEPTTSTSTAAPVTTPSGVRGAVHLDDGYVELGSGPKVVDLFIDPLCPFCKLFEETSGPMLFAEATAGRATLRVHPLAVLNRLSQGTSYSTRASAMFVAVAAQSPDDAQNFLIALYAQQPAENSTGLTDTQLQQMAVDAGSSPVSAEDTAQYQVWVDEHTRLALTGPLTATDSIMAITQVPTVLVNRTVFTGNSDETLAFAAFYRDR